MSAEEATVEASSQSRGFRLDYWKFWFAMSVANLGMAFTTFALPLLIFKLTRSAASLAIGNALTYLPYLLFGLAIGAWVDRTNRKRFMIVAGIVRGLLVGSIAFLSLAGSLSIGAVYVVIFCVATLGTGFNSAQLTAVPNLVPADDIVRANGRIQASYSASLVAGPALAGLLTAVVPVPMLMLVDMVAFLVSGVAVLSIRASFNAGSYSAERTTLLQDVLTGLRYVFGHPVLRPLSIMTALFVFVGITTNAQLVLFAKQRFHATDAEAGLLYTAGGVGFLVFSLLAGWLRRRLSFSRIVLSAGIAKGFVLLLLGLTPWYAAALVLWGASEGISMLYTINSLSLRQAIVPSHLLGRVMGLAAVISWSAIPLGTALGGAAIQVSGSAATVYAAIGVVHVCVAVPFLFTGLRRAERFVEGGRS